MADTTEVIAPSRSVTEIKRNPIMLESDVMIFDTGKFEQMTRIATAMAQAKLVPKHFHGSPGDCLLVVEQAARWGMSPFAVAQKTYLISGVLGYEAQLVAAVINSSPILEGRLRHEHKGEGSKLRCIVYGKVKGEDQERVQKSPEIGAITTKNSPLWKVDPEQQLLYWTQRAWARAHAPDVMLGIYAPEDLATSHYFGGERFPDERPQLSAYQDRTETIDQPAQSGDAAKETPANNNGAESTDTKPAETKKAAKDKKATPPADKEPPKTIDVYTVARTTGGHITYTQAGEAVDLMLEELDKAQKQSGQAGLDGIWESNAVLLATLRENGHDDLAQALNDECTKRIDQERQKAAEEAKKRGEAEAAKKAKTAASATAAAQDKAAYDERNPPPPDVTGGDAAAPAAAAQAEEPKRDLFQIPPGVKMPTSPLHGGSWFVYANTLKDVIAATPASQLADLVDRVIAAELKSMAEKRPDDYQAIMAALEARRP